MGGTVSEAKNLGLFYGTVAVAFTALGFVLHDLGYW